MKYALVAVVLLFALRPGVGFGDDTCPPTNVAGDQDLWNENPSFKTSWYRDMVAAEFNMKKSDWDEGWGWNKFDEANPHTFGFPKMTSAAYVLWAGINDDLELQGTWNASNLYSSYVPNAPYPRLSAVRTSDTSLQVFYRDGDGKLRNVVLSGDDWRGGQSAPNRTDKSLSDELADPKNKYLIASDPVAVWNTGVISVFARSMNHELLHFSFEASAGWRVENVTAKIVRNQPFAGSDRYFFHSDPIVVDQGGDVHILAHDSYHHLIYHHLTSSGWTGADLTELTGGTFFVTADIAAANVGEDLHVFARSKSLDQLYHFHWSSSTGWKAVNLSATLAGDFRISGKPSALALQDQVAVVFRDDYRIKLYLYPFNIFAPLVPGGWIGTAIASNYPAESDPVVAHRQGSLQVFYRSENNQLINVDVGSGSQITSRNLSAMSPAWWEPQYTIEGTPVVSVASDGRIDVVARTFSGHLYQWYWTPQLGWNLKRVHFDAGVSPINDKVLGDPVIVRRSASALEVFAGRLPTAPATASRIIYFSSATGLILNPWHTRDEYTKWASGSLHGFDYIPENESGNANASYSSGTVNMKCPIFDRSPTSRAGTMLHEATHAISDPFPHQANLPGTDPCQGDAACSDNWFYHSLRAPSGTLSGTTKNHSMNQIQMEFLCDVGEFGDGLTSNVIDNAMGEFSVRLARILNPPSWTCGQPRPLN
ncbi:MAG: hypothetical protein ACOY9D_09250 [Pseudomonadota bacterium]